MLENVLFSLCGCMKALMVSTSDTVGGAARSAFRLHQGFRRINFEHEMLVQSKRSDDEEVVGTTDSASGVGQVRTGLRLTLNQLPLKRYQSRGGLGFSPQWLPDRVLPKTKQIDPDVVNLHWVRSGFVQIETLARLNRPIVWTLHDMWPFTGGCHYDGDCGRYLASCGACPQLGSDKERDLSRSIWKRKAKAYEAADLTIVAPSNWLANCARESALFKNFRVERIPYGIDTDVYRPMGKRLAREALGLPLDKQLILFGSLKATSDRRKGFHFLQAALQELSLAVPNDSVELVVFGASGAQQPPEYGFKTRYLGSFSDDLSLSLVYSAADAFILPSVQENLANTIIEALVCGVPCLAFDIGGMPDMIAHKENGYLAQPYEVEDLAKGLSFILNELSERPYLSKEISDRARNVFPLELQATRYRSLFQELVKGRD